MILSEIKLWTKMFFKSVGCCKLIIIIYIFVLSAIIFLSILLNFSYSYSRNQGYCLADCFMFLSNPSFWGLFIIPLSIFLIFHLLKYDNNFNFISRFRSKSSIWFQQVFKSFVISFCLTIYSVLLTLFIGSFLSDNLINWNIENSIYFLVNKTTTDNYTFLEVVLITFFSMLIIMITINLVAVFLQWVTNNSTISWLYVILISGLNLFGGKYCIISGRAIVGYREMQNIIYSVLGMVLSVILIIIVIILGKVFSKRKEFLYE